MEVPGVTPKRICHLFHSGTGHLLSFPALPRYFEYAMKGIWEVERKRTMGIENAEPLRKSPDELSREMKGALEQIRKGEIGKVQDVQLDHLKTYGVLNAEGNTLLQREQELRKEMDLKLDAEKARVYTHVDNWGRTSSPYTVEELREDRKMCADGTDTRETRERKMEELRKAEEVKLELQRMKLGLG
jgi:hypothetical protein